MAKGIKQPVRIVFCGLFLLLFFFLPFNSNSVFAQDQTLIPQKVTAVLHTQRYNEECLGSPIDFYLEAWNVGEAGGSQYGQAVLKINYYTCDSMNGPGTELKTDVLTSSFSGGPKGTGTFNVPTYTDGRPQTSTFHHWILEFDTTVVRVGRKNDPTSWYELKVDNPEAFSAFAPQPKVVTSTPDKGCKPSVGGLSGLKPGDVLSPSVEFTDIDGKPVAPLSAVWYINGKQTYSTTWDGKETKLELQYTCPDHSTHSKDYFVSAYIPPAEPPAADQPAANPPADVQPGADQPNPPSSPQPGNAIPVAVAAGLAVGIAGIAGIVVAVGVAVAPPPVKAPPPQVPVQQPPPVNQTTPPPVTPPAQQAAPPPVPAPPVPAPPYQPPPPVTPPQDPEISKLSPEEKAQKKAELEGEISKVLKDYAEAVKDKEFLERLKKRNLIKFTIKKVLDVVDWVTLNAFELGKKTLEEMTPERYKIMERLFQKHDTSKDTEIIVKIHNMIQAKEKEIRILKKKKFDLQMRLYKY